MIKNEIMAYVTALTDVVGDGEVTNIYSCLKNLLDFVADFKEEENSDGEQIYVKRVVELQNENEELKDEIEDLKEIRSVTLGTGKELQELKSKLAEVEKATEYTCKLYHSASMKLAKEIKSLKEENNRLKENEKLKSELELDIKFDEEMGEY